MFFYVLLTVYLGMILVNNQPDAQFFFAYVYFYSLHVSCSYVPISRRIVVSMIYVTLSRWLPGMHNRRSSTQSDINQMSHWYNNSPDDGHMAVRNMYRIEINIHGKLCVMLAIYKEQTIIHYQTLNCKWYEGWFGGRGVHNSETEHEYIITVVENPNGGPVWEQRNL